MASTSSSPSQPSSELVRNLRAAATAAAAQDIELAVRVGVLRAAGYSRTEIPAKLGVTSTDLRYANHLLRDAADLLAGNQPNADTEPHASAAPPIGEIVDAPVETLVPHPGAARLIAPDRLAQLAAALDRQLLYVRPLVALVDGAVIAGVQRLLAAREAGWETVPMIYVDVDERRAGQLAVADNDTYGQWDRDALLQLLEPDVDELLALARSR